MQDTLVNISFLLITVIVNQMGVIASAALGVVEKIIVFAMLPPAAISAAVSTMTAQNYGAGLRQRMRQGLITGIGLALLFGIPFCCYVQLYPGPLPALFTHAPAIIRMAGDYLHGYGIDCIIVCFLFCINSYFSGQGNSWFPMLHSIAATFLARIPLSWLAGHLYPDSLFPMGFAAPLATSLSLVICLLYMYYGNKRAHALPPSQPFPANDN